MRERESEREREREGKREEGEREEGEVIEEKTVFTGCFYDSFLHSFLIRSVGKKTGFSSIVTFQ